MIEGYQIGEKGLGLFIQGVEASSTGWLKTHHWAIPLRLLSIFDFQILMNVLYQRGDTSVLTGASTWQAVFSAPAPLRVTSWPPMHGIVRVSLGNDSD